MRRDDLLVLARGSFVRLENALDAFAEILTVEDAAAEKRRSKVHPAGMPL